MFLCLVERRFIYGLSALLVCNSRVLEYFAYCSIVLFVLDSSDFCICYWHSFAYSSDKILCAVEIYSHFVNGAFFIL